MSNRNQINIAQGLPKIEPLQGPFTLGDFDGDQDMCETYLKVTQMAIGMDKQIAAQLAEENKKNT